MPIGPIGERRPNDPAANAVLIGKVATRMVDERQVKPAARKGGRARAEALTDERRSEIARRGAQARWDR